ncbi:MAG: SMC-Scp complex subunit ScpB [bacterium]
MSEAPDGTPMEVRRNYGKPNTAAQILEKLRADKKKAKKAAPVAEEVVVKPAPAAHADDLHAIAETIRKENAGNPQAPMAPMTPTTAMPKALKARAKAAKSGTTSPAPNAPTPADVPASNESAAPTVAEPAKAAKPTPPHAPLNTKGMQPKHVVEAALFSAGKPIAIEEIAHETKLSPDTIKKAIKELADDYEGRDTVLEVGKAGAKWAMQVRSRAAEPAARFAPMEIAPKLLKTLALIAYHQPMKQSELVNMIGTKVYEHIPELIERGLVRAREEGPTKILATTPLFPEYFGLDAEDQEGVRAALAKLVGLPPPTPRPDKVQVVFEETQGVPPADLAAAEPSASGPPS